MFSETIKEALKREVVGQPQAINAILRGATRLMSGMTPRERSWCAYMFIGPPGTGRAHIVRTLARFLHGDEAVFTVNCNSGSHVDPWMWFVQQLGPLLVRQSEGTPGERRPLNLLLVQDVECAHKELLPMLARVLETGDLPLHDGRMGRLDNCMVFLTSGLCAREILEDSSRFGFGGSALDDDGEEEDPILKTCRLEAENTLGLDLIAQLDDIVVFRRLEEDHLAKVLESHFARMSRWLAARGVQCELLPEAKAFLLERGSQRKLLGARDLILTHRHLVEFPVADLLMSHKLAAGENLLVNHVPGEKHLHFTVQPPTGTIPDAYQAVPVEGD